jgi:hypothetical protein
VNSKINNLLIYRETASPPIPRIWHDLALEQLLWALIDSNRTGMLPQSDAAIDRTAAPESGVRFGR